MRTAMLLIALSLTFNTVNAQEEGINTSDFIADCTRYGQDANGYKQMGIWVPAAFWAMALAQSGQVPKEYGDALTEEMKKYTVFFLVDYKSTVTGLKFKTEDQIRSTLRLTDSSKRTLKPLRDEEISMFAKGYVQNFKPVFSKMLGQFGDGMNIFLFKAEMKNGEPLIDMRKKNSFSLNWADAQLQWKLPLASALPPKYCPVDNEKLKGSWNYCPEHGVKLGN